MTTTNRAATRRERANGTAVPSERAASTTRKPRAGGFDAELRALAEKHTKRSSKLRAEVTKLESKLAVKRALLDAADEPLRKIERVLADRPELPGLPHAEVGVADVSGYESRERVLERAHEGVAP
jgi:hypothetical protein